MPHEEAHEAGDKLAVRAPIELAVICPAAVAVTVLVRQLHFTHALGFYFGPVEVAREALGRQRLRLRLVLHVRQLLKAAHALLRGLLPVVEKNIII